MRANVIEPCLVVANNRVVFRIMKLYDSEITVFRSRSKTFKLAIEGLYGRWVRVAVDTHTNQIVFV